MLRASLTAAGQDRLVVEGPCDEARSFAAARLPGGPIHVAPFVDVAWEASLHGRLEPSGRWRHGVALVSDPAASPGPGGAEVRDAAPDVAAALRRSMQKVAGRLHDLGYFGPFAIDAFAWVDADGTTRLHTPSEVNARYTMHFGRGAPELVGLEHTAE